MMSDGPVTKWLITGASGQLGFELISLLTVTRPKDTIVAPSRLELDLYRSSEIREAIQRVRPDVLVNCAAWTDVDAAEEHEALAHEINALAPEVMSGTLASVGHGLLVQISTDYVFDGCSRREHEADSQMSPLSAYGRTKAAGETAVRNRLPDRSVVVRTAWLYGRRGSNFPKAILRQLQAGVALSVVDDQFGHPTNAHDVAVRTVSLALAMQAGSITPGTYHAVNSGVASWWDFAREIADQAGYGHVEIGRIKSEDLDRDASRPNRVQLSDRAATEADLPPMRSWKSALLSALPEFILADGLTSHPPVGA